MVAYGRGLDDGDGLDDLLLVELGTGTVKVADDGGHAGLVAHGSSQVDGLLGVILGERLGLTTVVDGSLARKEGHCARVLAIGPSELAMMAVGAGTDKSRDGEPRTFCATS